MTRRTLLAAPAAVAAVALGAALAAGGAPAKAPPRTLTLTAVLDTQSVHTNDLAPEGPSAGDVTVYSASLRRGSRLVGRMQGQSTASDPRYRGNIKTQYLTLRDGTIAIVGGGQDGAPGTRPRGTAIPDAIAGGTGRYAGARGSVMGHDLDDRRLRLTLRFVR